MQNKHKLYMLLICFIQLCWFNNLYAGVNQSNPVSLLQYVADNMINGLRANKATLRTKPQIVYGLAYKYVVPYADLNAMAKQVLPARSWNSATPAQRAQFQKEFTKTLIRTYASALTSYEDQSIKFYPVRGNISKLSTVTVDSEIVSSQSTAIHVTYRLIRHGSVWRFVDMSVEGVSLLDSFRSQFADILEQGNMQDLLKRMNNHNLG